MIITRKEQNRISSYLAAMLLGPAIGVWAGDGKAVVAQDPPPLPLHQIEGNGGILTTLSAYIVNPPAEGDFLGLPSIGFGYVNLGHGRNLEAVTVTEAPFARLELGYAYNNLNLGDLPLDIFQTTGGAAEHDRNSHGDAQLQRPGPTPEGR